MLQTRIKLSIARIKIYEEHELKFFTQRFSILTIRLFIIIFFRFILHWIFHPRIPSTVSSIGVGTKERIYTTNHHHHHHQYPDLIPKPIHRYTLNRKSRISSVQIANDGCSFAISRIVPAISNCANDSEHPETPPPVHRFPNSVTRKVAKTPSSTDPRFGLQRSSECGDPPPL